MERLQIGLVHSKVIKVQCGALALITMRYVLHLHQQTSQRMFFFYKKKKKSGFINDIIPFVCLFRKLWDALTGDVLHSFEHKHIVRACAFSEVRSTLYLVKLFCFELSITFFLSLSLSLGYKTVAHRRV